MTSCCSQAGMVLLDVLTSNREQAGVLGVLTSSWNQAGIVLGFRIIVEIYGVGIVGINGHCCWVFTCGVDVNSQLIHGCYCPQLRLLGIGQFCADVLNVVIPVGVFVGIVCECMCKQVKGERIMGWDVGMCVVKQPWDYVFSDCGICDCMSVSH